MAISSLFLAHGSPMLAIEENDYTRFLAELAGRFDPKAIVVFTAHWERPVTTVTSTDGVYETIYDFGGFPDELYQVAYPARGSKAVAAKMIERLRAAGIEAATDSARGLDHGTWTLLRRMYPRADIPVVQASVHPFLPPQEQFKIGESLRGLGDEGVLVIGSGVTVHNLRMIKWGQRTPEPWAVEFDDWLISRLREWNLPQLFDYEREAPHARLAVPRAEHFVPLFIAMGSGDPQRKPEVLYRSYDMGTLSYLCLGF